MIEIRLTLDATPAIIGAVRDLAGAIHAAANNARPAPAGEPCGQLTPPASHADAPDAPEKGGAAEKAQNLPSDAPADAERPEAQENVEEPKKRKSRAKKATSESNAPVAPASETPAEPEPAYFAEDPAPAEETPAHVEDTPAPDPVPAVVHLDVADPLAGKGQTGEILAELTRKAIGYLDARGVDRSEANRRIRDYCAHNGIKFPSFPALLQAVGYAESIAICTGA